MAAAGKARGFYRRNSGRGQSVGSASRAELTERVQGFHQYTPWEHKSPSLEETSLQRILTHRSCLLSSGQLKGVLSPRNLLDQKKEKFMNN